MQPQPVPGGFEKYSVSDASSGEYELNTTTGNRSARSPIGGLTHISPKYPFTEETARRTPVGGRRLPFVTSDFQFARATVNLSWSQIARNPTSVTGRFAPNIGSIVALELESQRRPDQKLPGFVALSTAFLVRSGYLPGRYAPFPATAAPVGILLMSVLTLMLDLIGVLGLNWKVGLSTAPFWGVALLHFVKGRKPTPSAPS
jgi:hypothetical protein